jgi:hypothetical protein
LCFIVGMSRTKDPIRETDLQGFKHFPQLARLLKRLHDVGCARDRAGNRQLYMDQYVTLLLLYLFNPVCDSLRAIQRISQLEKVQKKLGIRRCSLGSLSEAARVFDSQFLKQIVSQLAQQTRSAARSTHVPELNEVLTIVDGTLLAALPKVVEQLWAPACHEGFKAHVQYEVLKNAPVAATITGAHASEIAVLTERLEAGRFYLLDRGYAKYQLMQDIIEAGSSSLVRIKSHFHVETIESRPLDDAARKAGVLRDEVVHLGQHPRYRKLRQPVRLIELVCTERTAKSVRQMRRKKTKETTMVLVTDRLDLTADILAALYRFRWEIEIFFRWFKHLLGCRHLVSRCRNGVELQVYTAILVCLLIARYTGLKPNKALYEMICWYLTGWASEQELMNHLTAARSRLRTQNR